MDGGIVSREAKVLGTGLSEGLSKVVSTTWSDLSKGAGELLDHPLDTAGNYLKNHWQDAAAGAAIAFVNPTSIANTALVAWSLRGVVTSTGSAMLKASRDGADTDAIGKQLGHDLSHEGTAFLASMPMALAGSMVGRAGANAVFGKNLAAADMLAGRVSREQVRSNLLDIKDTIRPPKTKLVVTDLDGTAWSFADYFAPAMRENIKTVAEKSKITPQQAAESMGTVMDGRRTHEWPWVLEESTLAKRFPGTTAEFTSQVVDPFWTTVDSYRAVYLKAFPEVPGVLTELNKRGVNVVALSDAPMYMAKRRVYDTGLDHYIKELWALHSGDGEVAAVREASALGYGMRRVDRFMNGPSRLSEANELPRHSEKPNPAGLNEILAKHGVRPKEALFIGDSRVKDGGVAHAAGVRYIWARYGAQYPLEYQEILGSLKPPADPTAAVVAPKAKVYPPILAEAASYGELLNHLQPKADYGAIARSTASALKVAPRLKSLTAFNLIPGREQQ